MSSTQIRGQEVHTNGPVLDDSLLADPEVYFSFVIQYIKIFSELLAQISVLRERINLFYL